MGLVRDSFDSNKNSFIYCDTFQNNILMKKGIIKQNSIEKIKDMPTKIVVGDNQFLIVVSNNKIIDFAAQSGQYTFNKNIGPLLITGQFSSKLVKSFEENKLNNSLLSDDIEFYFINTGYIKKNKFGTKTPLKFKDSSLNSILSIRCYGEYVFEITNPIEFYYNYCNNVKTDYIVDEDFSNSLLEDFLNCLEASFTRLSTKGISYNDLTSNMEEISTSTSECLSSIWNRKGLNLVHVNIASSTPTDESADAIATTKEEQIEEIIDTPNVVEEQIDGEVIPVVENIFGDTTQVEEEEEIKCPNCGAIIKANFCDVCGTKKPE